MESFGLMLRTARKRLGFTQKDAATLVRVSQSGLSSWEADKHLPSRSALRRISKAFNLPHDELFTLWSTSSRPVHEKREAFGNASSTFRLCVAVNEATAIHLSAENFERMSREVVAIEEALGTPLHLAQVVAMVRKVVAPI